MTWTVQNPGSLMVEQACALYNATQPRELPRPSGHWGIDAQVWSTLIELTQGKCRQLGIPVRRDNDLKGMCLWASAIVARFYVSRLARIDTHVVRVNAAADHYFAVVRGGGQAGICDITCNQFGAPDFIAGSLGDVHGVAQKVMVKGGGSLYDAYVTGAGAGIVVL
jgi:hypothetical protein